MKQYKHIFFDLDRTLWDFEQNSNEALKEIFEKFQLHDQIDSFNDFVERYHYCNDLLWEDYRKGRLSKEILRKKRFEQTLEYFGLPDNQKAFSMNEMYLDVCPKKCILVPYTTETINYLKKKYSLHILTNGFKETQHKKLNNTGLINFFDHIFTSEEIGINKPKSGIFAHAISSLNAKKQECIMVGDDFDVDIVGAMKFGIDQAWFNPTGLQKSPEPTYTISSLKELVIIL